MKYILPFSINEDTSMKRGTKIKSKYKYVTGEKTAHNTIKWFPSVFFAGGKTTYYDNERDAALAVDKTLIRQGKNPVNILKRK